MAVISQSRIQTHGLIGQSWARCTPNRLYMVYTMDRSWDTLGTVVAVLSPLQDFVIISLAAETS